MGYLPTGFHFDDESHQESYFANVKDNIKKRKEELKKYYLEEYNVDLDIDTIFGFITEEQKNKTNMLDISGKISKKYGITENDSVDILSLYLLEKQQIPNEKEKFTIKTAIDSDKI